MARPVWSDVVSGTVRRDVAAVVRTVVDGGTCAVGGGRLIIAYISVAGAMLVADVAGLIVAVVSVAGFVISVVVYTRSVLIAVVDSGTIIVSLIRAVL